MINNRRTDQKYRETSNQLLRLTIGSDLWFASLATLALVLVVAPKQADIGFAATGAHKSTPSKGFAIFTPANHAIAHHCAHEGRKKLLGCKNSSPQNDEKGAVKLYGN
ncbi:hypothetical protein DM02DRAFT_619745, partial [Periconia macrospinosa]